ncbi:MAG: magnesium/cobalt transporter CorA [Deltaproteobacteria bacterium]|nr:MAG: magnesium/cobalt transporter CorA [Deltaproteobacteria bacterium]
MRKFIKRSSKKAGSAPGTLVFVGEKKAEKVTFTIIDYDADNLQETEVASVDECLAYRDKKSVTWINISGLHDVVIIEKLGEKFNLHPLLMEDIVNTEQRPKLEDYDDYLFVILKMLYSVEGNHVIQHEQISLIVTPSVVISLQEKEGDVFDPVRQRIRKGKGRIRKNGTDYLAYALIDTVVDHYFKVFEEIGEKIEELQEQVLEKPSPELLQSIQNLKREMIFIRKSIWPLREIISGLLRSESALIKEDILPYLRDVYDHTIQVIDTAETFRDMLSGMLDIYLSSLSNKMNEVMKVLTIMATIFIPLTFIAGIYGMNFEFMPELKWHWSYPVLWIILITIFVAMVFWFRRKKWL